MREFLYFLAGGILASWLFAALLIASGGTFYNSECLECSGLFNLSCEVVEPTMSCQFWGTLEETGKSTQYLYAHGSAEGILSVAILYIFYFGIPGGVLAYILKRLVVFLFHKVRRL